MGLADAEIRIRTVSVEFEVRGEIQGLYFLTHCKEEALRLGISGWIKHGIRGEIIGIIQGPQPRVTQMISWLTNKGAPGSRIENCSLYNYRYISKLQYKGFTLRL